MATVGTVVFPEGLFHGIRPHQDVAIYGTVHATTLGIRSHLKQSWLCDDMRDEVPLLAVENDDLALARMDREELVTRHIRHSVRIEAGCVHDYSRVQRSPVGADRRDPPFTHLHVYDHGFEADPCAIPYSVLGVRNRKQVWRYDPCQGHMQGGGELLREVRLKGKRLVFADQMHPRHSVLPGSSQEQRSKKALPALLV